ncbi:phage tail assembly chaperone [Roseobacter sp. YSTF-M11]|uniref:Phage tail assembly chaperone n=1 Tax=Roseobacter insulae TaxID=2859783 RepID=A0A9X1K0T4_9RHOB|nr:rcc01693 family protein [Roseobacter insulae]MBW4708539.1 phage tail assembly chaperone [Roseobacter insulae]
MSSLDWPALMRVAFRGCGLSPEAFWELTPAEFQLIVGDPAQSGPLLTSGLEALMAAYPDNENEDELNDR